MIHTALAALFLAPQPYIVKLDISSFGEGGSTTRYEAGLLVKDDDPLIRNIGAGRVMYLTLDDADYDKIVVNIHITENSGQVFHVPSASVKLGETVVLETIGLHETTDAGASVIFTVDTYTPPDASAGDPE